MVIACTSPPTPNPRPLPHYPHPPPRCGDLRSSKQSSRRGKPRDAQDSRPPGLGSPHISASTQNRVAHHGLCRHAHTAHTERGGGGKGRGARKRHQTSAATSVVSKSDGKHTPPYSHTTAAGQQGGGVGHLYPQPHPHAYTRMHPPLGNAQPVPQWWMPGPRTGPQRHLARRPTQPLPPHQAFRQPRPKRRFAGPRRRTNRQPNGAR
jgi:hypothetical protein